MRLPLALAAVAALFDGQSAAAAPAPCLTGAEAEAVMITAVPTVMTTLRLMCATSLPSTALLRQSNSAFAAKYAAAADTAWPLAKVGLGKIAGPDVQPMLESRFARVALGTILAPIVAANFKVRDCAPTNRMLTALEPLPPRNAAAAFVAFWQMSHADRKDQKDILPICPYGQK